MPSLTRLIHDSYATFAHRFGQPLVSHENPPGEHLVEFFPIHNAGSEPLSNTSEHRILPDEPAELTYRWPSANGYVLKNVFMAEDYGHIFFNKNEHLSFHTGTLRLNPKKVRRPIKILSKVIDTPVVHLCGPNHENHGHPNTTSGQPCHSFTSPQFLHVTDCV